MSKKFLFTLVGINISRIEQKYGLATDGDAILDDQVENTTKLSELNHDRQTPKIYPFLDETKKLHNCNISIVDFSTGMKVSFLQYNCYWDRHPIHTKPLGCPIWYCSNQAEKTYWSCISKDVYTIRENITKMRTKLSRKNADININTRGQYISDGVFCSLNCIQAWYDDNKDDSMYDFTEELLSQMCEEITGVRNAVITPAPHWRTLEPYGGFQTIVKYRDGFNTVSYECHGTTLSIPKFIPVGTLYEEKLSF